jgi:hypothetical protein
VTAHPVAEALQGRLLDLINDTLAEHGGGIVNGFLLAVDYLDGDGDPSFVISVAPDQRASLSSGLARLLHISTDRDIWNVLDE